MTDQKNNILEVRDLVVDFPIFGGIMQRRVNSVHAVRKVTVSYTHLTLPTNREV